MFESLSSKLQKITSKMKGKVRVTEQDIKDMMREIRMALLEADVNYTVVKEFCSEMKEKCLNQDVTDSFTPGQQIVKIVHDSLVELLGSGDEKIKVSPAGFTVIMLYGLQGAGKTTTAVKLAKLLKADGKKPMVASVDVHRPAAAKQLEVLAQENKIDSYIEPEETDAVKIANNAIARAKYMLCNFLIVDTAGRTVVDEELMEELRVVDRQVNPTERILVVDAMIGQEAVNVAEAFDKEIGMDGFIMTKLDGDARGGAALSIRKITGKPIKYICVGEKTDAIEVFHPDRMADRILGMGDVVSLFEKASQNFDEETAKRTAEKMMNNQFDLNDLLDQFLQMKKMGSMKDVIGMIPGISGKVDTSKVDDSIIDKNIAIIRSMTKRERKHPQILNASRRKRIASGSGTLVQDVNALIKQYDQAAQMMKRFSKGGFKLPKSLGALGGLGGLGGFPGKGKGKKGWF